MSTKGFIIARFNGFNDCIQKLARYDFDKWQMMTNDNKWQFNYRPLRIKSQTKQSTDLPSMSSQWPVMTHTMTIDNEQNPETTSAGVNRPKGPKDIL